MKPIFFLLTILLPILSCGQSLPVKPLTIGDTVPDITFRKIVNFKDSTARLSSFKGKLVIIDFWSSWCGPCIRSLPVMDSLQRLFGNDLKILIVTDDLEDRVRKFIQSKGIPKSLSLFIEAEGLEEMFPHKYIPHLVWISKNGKIVALTGHQEFTKENILMRLHNSELFNHSTKLQ